MLASCCGTGASVPMVGTLVKKVHVDDIPKSHQTDTGAIACISELLLLCARGGFPISKFVSNDCELLETLRAGLSETRPKVSELLINYGTYIALYNNIVNNY